MGYFTLDFKKAKGASDARMSDHIERRVIAPNVDPHVHILIGNWWNFPKV